MRKIWYGLLLALIIVGMFTQFSFSQEEIKSDLIMIGGGTTGDYYQMAAAIGNLLVEKLDYIKSAAAQVTGASIENARLLHAGKADFGLVSAGITYKAVTGINPFEEGNLTNLRTICWAHSSLTHLIVPADSDIDSVYDFKGKRVRLDVPGAGYHATALALLKEYDITIDDIEPYYIVKPWDAFKEGTLEVVPIGERLPSPYVTDIIGKRPIKLLPIEPEKVESFLKHNYGYKRAVIPSGTYPGIDYDVPTIDSAACFLTHKDVPEELVYQTVKLMSENIDYLTLSNVHFSKYEFSPDVVEGTNCPLHPGAERYYREIGLLE
jgi:uncharacterized protein